MYRACLRGVQNSEAKVSYFGSTRMPFHDITGVGLRRGVSEPDLVSVTLLQFQVFSGFVIAFPGSIASTLSDW